MKLARVAVVLASVIPMSGIAMIASAAGPAGVGADVSPIYGVAIPKGYRHWELIAPAVEAAPLNEIRAILGNTVATRAYQHAAQPFPDGTVLVKLAWKHIPSPAFGPASIPGDATTVQVMVKDSKRYAATGGWGFGRFIDGKPVDKAQHETCFACHQAHAKDHDYVFTRYAP
ncbi:MAG: cytochrome P460 family protein [Caulobacteraceae bacterium]